MKPISERLREYRGISRAEKEEAADTIDALVAVLFDAWRYVPSHHSENIAAQELSKQIKAALVLAGALPAPQIMKDD